MKIKCPKCNYEWDTNSELQYVTCPNCRLKVLNTLKIKKIKC